MRLLSAAFCALALSAPAFCQISVREEATRAHLVDGKTTISFALRNTESKPLDAIILLEWLGPAGERHGYERRALPIQPGESSAEIPLPLPDKKDPLLERLRYEINPGSHNYTAFLPAKGMLSLPNIADYAFTLGVVSTDIPRPGKPYQLRVLANHPATGKPVAGVEVASGPARATTDKDGVATLSISRNEEEDDSGWTDEVTAHLSDFVQTGESTPLVFWKGDFRIYTDKPLYQPGQTMHVRFLAIGGSGAALAGKEYEIRILNESDEVEHVDRVTTSRFGIASTDWQIPDNAKSGEYNIRVEFDEEPVAVYPIAIRRYELPSFRVTVKPDRAWYLLNDKAVVEVHADYLFGKPMTAGSVRVTEVDEDKPLLEGKLGPDGAFRRTIEASADIGDRVRFLDRHFIAFVTDTSTNRTEQRKFDLRVSREPLHIYVVKQEYTSAGARAYVSVFTPGGSPVSTLVEAVADGKVVGQGPTNKYGLARIDIPKDDADANELKVRASTPERHAVAEEVNLYDKDKGLWLETDHTLYHPGDPVRCRIAAEQPDLNVLVLAWNRANQTVFSRSIRLRDGRADLEIPYTASFGRVLSIGVVSGSPHLTASRAVVFPGPDNLILRAQPAAATYQPGQTAKVQFHASAEAALGISIVDQSVLERAATDSSFHRSYWDEDDTWNFGGITERQILNLDPAKIDGDLQLVAEAFMREPTLINNADDAWDEQRKAFAEAGKKALEPVRKALDENYLQTLESPKDEASLMSILGWRWQYDQVLDPWMRSYEIRFTTERADDVIRFWSAGPDKQFGTDDDFSTLEVRRKWFAKFEALIGETLKPTVDVPATEDEFVRHLDEAGIRFPALRDPWGTSLRVEIRPVRDRREIRILSAGPDRRFDSPDDVRVCTFSGPYFVAMSERIARVLDAAKQFPRTTEGLQAVLASAGIDLASLRDPWGRNYYATFNTNESYTDNVRIYSYSEYNGTVEQRKQITPVKRTMLSVELRSVGEDGVRDTYDDFVVANFSRLVEPAQHPEAAAPAARQIAVTVGGTGTITGVVTDASGAVVPGVVILLNGIYRTETHETGSYSFRGLKPGSYQLDFEASGFQKSEIGRVPVSAGHVTRVNTVLQIGATTESVKVEASAMPVATDTAEMASVAAAPSATSTPRVREYFPETLYWQPELITDAAGNASVSVKLADTITTWHVAVIGSTVDGKISETSTEIRAFQPFMVDLDVPPILTAGDEIQLPVPIRNYLEHAQKVSVSASVPPQLSLRKPVQQPGEVQPSSSSNAILDLRAESSASAARLRVIARAKDASDAIEKPVSIHPDGERRELSVSDVVSTDRVALLNVPAAAIPGSLQAEVKFYPSLLARIFESMESMLTRPWGCGEQTISSTYPNFLFLKALRDARIEQKHLEAKALKNLNAGYQRLLGYQDESGGFTYWGHGDPNVALTAYAISFLHDAGDFVAIDEDRLRKAETWLKKQDTKQDRCSHALQIGALVRAGLAKDDDIDRMLGALAREAAKYDDPYAVAAFAQAALDAGKPEIARPAVEHLRTMAQDERGAAWWNLRANTPFHGWGRWGQVETTAMALSALAKWRKSQGADPAADTLMQRAALFLLRNADSSGVWATCQASVRSLSALLDLWSGTNDQKASKVDVLVNGTRAGSVAIPAGNEVQGPVTLNISSSVRRGMDNKIAFAGTGISATEVQTNAVWYEKWSNPETAKDLRFEARFSATNATINQPIACDVLVSRPTFRGYGMLIAEVGLPPGAEVDRGTLAALTDDPESGVDSFEVAPDRVTFYIWPRAADSKFRFVFRPRFAMRARATASVLYDYYNPDERVVIAPELFTIE